MLLKRNISFFGTNKRLHFHCQSQVRLLFRVMQTSKFCLEEILGENLRKAHFSSCYLIHKGETLLALAQHTLGRSWPGKEEKNCCWEEASGPTQGSQWAQTQHQPSPAGFRSHCEVSWLFFISVAVIFCFFFFLIVPSLLTNQDPIVHLITWSV